MTNQNKPRAKHISTRVNKSGVVNPLRLGGWLQGKKAYLWFGDNCRADGGFCIGTLGGYKLYRLAKAIVRHYEAK